MSIFTNISKRHDDNRGSLIELNYDFKIIEKLNLDFNRNLIVFNESKNTLRGLHCQKYPFFEYKILSVVEGSILDVIIDVRIGSSTFLKIFYNILSKNNLKTLLVPSGFLHGYITLESNTTILYKIAGNYSPNNAITIKYNDPTLNVDWGVDSKKIIISDSDYNGLFFNKAKRYFNYEK